MKDVEVFLRDNGQTEAKSFFLETDIDIVAQDLPQVLSEATSQGCKRLASRASNFPCYSFI